METMNAETLRKLLSENVMEIYFTKADGTKRMMLASTNRLYIPEDYQDTPTKREPNPDVVRVVDVEINEWRSIRVDRIETCMFSDKPVLEARPEVAEVAA